MVVWGKGLAAGRNNEPEAPANKRQNFGLVGRLLACRIQSG
jgi:hypothetical protein